MPRTKFAISQRQISAMEVQANLEKTYWQLETRRHFIHLRSIALNYIERKCPKPPKAIRTTKINQPYTCHFFLSQMCEVVMTGICQNVPAVPKISDDFPKTSEHSGKCPKIFRRLLSTSEAIQKTTILACFHFTRTQSHLYAPFWNIFMETELNFRY